MSLAHEILRKSSYSAVNGNCVEVGAFRKSSHSFNGDCVEVGAFAKSSYSGGANSNCVEAGQFGMEIRVADTTQQGDPDRPVLAFEPEVWQMFVDSFK